MKHLFYGLVLVHFWRWAVLTGARFCMRVRNVVLDVVFIPLLHAPGKREVHLAGHKRYPPGRSLLKTGSEPYIPAGLKHSLPRAS